MEKNNHQTDRGKAQRENCPINSQLLNIENRLKRLFERIAIAEKALQQYKQGNPERLPI